MSNEELVVVNTFTEAVSAVSSLITSYRRTRTVDKLQLKIVSDRVRACIAMQRIRLIGEVGRASLTEIGKTVNMLNSMNLEGPMVDYAMKIIESMTDGLYSVQEDLNNKFCCRL